MKLKANLTLAILFVYGLLLGQTTKYPVFNNNPYLIGSTTFAPIISTSDSGHILSFTWSVGVGNNPDDSTLLIKTDNDFVPVWRKFFTAHLYGKRILSYPDGSLLFFSRTGCFDLELPSGQTEWYCPRFNLYKLDSDGESVWSKKIVQNLTPFDAFQIDSNTIKIGGKQRVSNSTVHPVTTTDKPVIMNFDSDGNFINGKIFEGLFSGGIYSMAKTQDTGEYYAMISNFGYIAKFSADDTILWIKKILLDNSGSFTYDDGNYSTQILDNGDLMVGCRLLSMYTISRISPDGNLIWSKKIEASYGSTFGGITELSSGDLVVTHVSGYATQRMSNATKIDAAGNQLWSKSFWPATSVSPAYEKGPNELYFGIRGYSTNDVSNVEPAVFVTDASGNSMCDGQDADILFLDANVTLNAVTSTITYTAMPMLQTMPEPPSLLVSLENQTSTTECQLLDTPDFVKQELQIFPNPNSGSYTIKADVNILKIEVFSILGQKIFGVNPNQSEWSFSQQNQGIYLARIETENGTKVMKIVVTE